MGDWAGVRGIWELSVFLVYFSVNLKLTCRIKYIKLKEEKKRTVVVSCMPISSLPPAVDSYKSTLFLNSSILSFSCKRSPTMRGFCLDWLLVPSVMFAKFIRVLTGISPFLLYSFLSLAVSASNVLTVLAVYE